MALKKKITWSAGQTPTPKRMPALPPYSPEPAIADEELKSAWSRAYIGQMCQIINPMFARKGGGEAYPMPVMFSGHGWYVDDTKVEAGQPVIYIGRTNVNCLGTKGKIISKPYVTIFYHGIKYLVSNPNDLKPIE